MCASMGSSKRKRYCKHVRAPFPRVVVFGVLLLAIMSCKPQPAVGTATDVSTSTAFDPEATIPRTMPTLRWVHLDVTPEELLDMGPAFETVACNGAPLLTQDDLLAFDWENQRMTLTDEAERRLSGLESAALHSPGLAFALCLGDDVIYAGALWSALSSVPYPGIVIDVHPARQGEPLPVLLGYPEGLYTDLTDVRENDLLYETLRKLGVLDSSL